jgi:hypothetical protein
MKVIILFILRLSTVPIRYSCRLFSLSYRVLTTDLRLKLMRILLQSRLPLQHCLRGNEHHKDHLLSKMFVSLPFRFHLCQVNDLLDISVGEQQPKPMEMI